MIVGKEDCGVIEGASENIAERNLNCNFAPRECKYFDHPQMVIAERDNHNLPITVEENGFKKFSRCVDTRQPQRYVFKIMMLQVVNPNLFSSEEISRSFIRLGKNLLTILNQVRNP